MCGEASSMAQWLPGKLDLSSMSMYYNYYLPQVWHPARGAPGARGANQHQTRQGDHAHCSTLCSIFRCLRSISWIDLTSSIIICNNGTFYELTSYVSFPFCLVITLWTLECFTSMDWFDVCLKRYFKSCFGRSHLCELIWCVFEDGFSVVLCNRSQDTKINSLYELFLVSFVSLYM